MLNNNTDWLIATQHDRRLAWHCLSVCLSVCDAVHALWLNDNPTGAAKVSEQLNTKIIPDSGVSYSKKCHNLNKWIGQHYVR